MTHPTPWQMLRPARRRALPGAAVLVTLFLAACAHAPQVVRLHLVPATSPSGIGASRALAVQMVDARAGAGAADLPSVAAARVQFPIQDDPVAALRQELLTGLRRQGFQPTAGSGDPSLTVSLQRFDYWVLKGIGTSDIRASVTLTAQAHRGRASFEVTYKADQHQKVAIVPRRVDVEEAVNGALTTVLQQLLADDQLLRFLASDG